MKRMLPLLLLSLHSQVFAIESKLIRIGLNGSTQGGLPSCESFRDWSKMSPSSRKILQRYWNSHVLPRWRAQEVGRKKQEIDDRQFFLDNRNSNNLDELYRQRREQKLRDRAGYASEQKRFYDALDAVINSLPPEDRTDAKIATTPLMSPPGGCNFP
jgi:hypothetical protein